MTLLNDTMSYIVGAYCRVQYRPKNTDFFKFLGNRSNARNRNKKSM